MCCSNKSVKVCAKKEAQSRRKVQGEILVAETKKRLHGRGAGWERTRRVAGLSRGTGVCEYIPGRKNSEDKTRSQETWSGFREQLAEPENEPGSHVGESLCFFFGGLWGASEGFGAVEWCDSDVLEEECNSGVSNELNWRRGAQAGGYLGIPDIMKKAGLGQCRGRGARKERWIYEHFTPLHNLSLGLTSFQSVRLSFLTAFSLFPCGHSAITSLRPPSPPKLNLNSFCLQTNSFSFLILFYYYCFCFSNNQSESLESISNSHFAGSLMFM